MLFTSFLFTSFLALVKYGNIDQIRQKLYYHWCDREEKLLLFSEFVSRSARFLKVMRETAVHSFPDSRSPFPVPGSRFPVPGFSNILSRTPSRPDIFYSAAVLKLSMRTKTGFPRFLGSKIPLSQSLYWRPSADQKARGLWVRDCLA